MIVMTNMKKMILGIDELLLLKHSYIAECNWNESLGGKKKPMDRYRKQLRKYGIVGRDKLVITKKIDQLINKIKK